MGTDDGRRPPPATRLDSYAAAVLVAATVGGVAGVFLPVVLVFGDSDRRVREDARDWMWADTKDAMRLRGLVGAAGAGALVLVAMLGSPTRDSSRRRSG